MYFSVAQQAVLYVP